MTTCRTAVLYANYNSYASYYDDWLDVFKSSSFFDCISFNIVHENERKKLKESIADFESVVLLHSVTGDSLEYAKACIPSLLERKCPLLSFVGNELNLPNAGMADKISFLKKINTEIIATQLLEEAGRFLYAETTAKIVSIPHALNPDAFYPTLPQDQRPIDIGARTFRYYPHMGDDDRNRLVDRFIEEGPKRGLKMDISTTKRFNREDWAHFLNSCKGTLATEAGSWWLERNDAIIQRINAWQAEQKKGKAHGIVLSTKSPLRRLAHCLPWNIKQRLIAFLRWGPIRYEAFEAEELDFDTVYEKFFRSTPKCPAYSKCISSRHFDAIGTKCCQIMFPGRYNDILEADKHYIALSPDFSNLEDVFRRFSDVDYRNQIVNAAYEHIFESHTYEKRIRNIYEILSTFRKGEPS